MTSNDWENRFRAVHDAGNKAWAEGRRTPSSMFTEIDRAFLMSIGCTDQELFDFVDDLNRYGEPDYETALALQRIRHRYFHEVQGGQWTGQQARMEDLPPKDLPVDGIAWLPRLIVKARLKLRGEMPPDLMYGCGGDRPFVRRMHTTLPDFLQLVWDCGDDDRKIIDQVKASAQG
jgi:hypothetical protein